MRKTVALSRDTLEISRDVCCSCFYLCCLNVLELRDSAIFSNSKLCNLPKN